MERSFEIGKEVKVKTPQGIVTGQIAVNYRNTNKNQFCVRFLLDGHITWALFSKKTGLAYMDLKLQQAGVFVIF